MNKNIKILGLYKSIDYNGTDCYSFQVTARICCKINWNGYFFVGGCFKHSLAIDIFLPLAIAPEGDNKNVFGFFYRTYLCSKNNKLT